MQSIAGLTIEPITQDPLCRSDRPKLLGKVAPDSEESVQAIVNEAASANLLLHTVSTGRNWGMGSYLPKGKEPDLLVDLSQLTEIGPIDTANACIRIQAGVTQNQLYEWLLQNAPEFRFNVTGASGATSIIGNGLERGMGYDGCRTDELYGFNAYLPDGTRLDPHDEWFHRGGFPKAGPNLDAFMFQSDAAVVTSAYLKLRRVQELELAVLVSGPHDAVFTTVTRAYQQELLTLPAHMGGNSRADIICQGLLTLHLGRDATMEETRKIFPMSEGHSAILALRGRRKVVKATLRELRAIASPGVKIQAVSDQLLQRASQVTRLFGLRNRATFVESALPLLALTWGVPSEAGMTAISELVPAEVDAHPEGVAYFNAGSPMDLDQSGEAESLITAEFPDLAITKIFLPRRGVFHICTVTYRPEDTVSTHARLEGLCSRLRQAGFPPYRLGSPNGSPWDTLIHERKLLLQKMVNPSNPSSTS